MNLTPPPGPLTGWTVICLRPSMQQAAARRAVRARGGVHVSLPGLRLVAQQAGEALVRALDCAAVVFTSPAAVHFAALQHVLELPSGVRCFAVGEGTARALARHGVRAIAPPPDAMHSDGVLALPQWQQLDGPVGLVTAPGGRGIIAAGLVRRGFSLRRAEVYRREPPRLDARHLRTLRQIGGPRAVLVSSAEALDAVLAILPADVRAGIFDGLVVASSPRLAELAGLRGFRATIIATAPTIQALLDALARHVATPGFR